MSNAFTFKCPHCGIEMEAQEEWRGLESSCPGCGNVITIPSKANPSQAPTGIIDEEPEQIPSYKYYPSVILYYLRNSSIVKALIGIVAILALVFVGYYYFSADREHQKKLKALGGFIAYDEEQWVNPGADFSVNTKDKHGLIRYESNKHSFSAKIKENYNFSMKPVFEQEPDGTRNIYLEIYTNTSLEKDCEILFESGTKRRYKIEFLRTYGPIKELKYYGIKLTPEEYYLYFVKDTPQRITITAFTRFSNTECFLTGRHHEFNAFHDMGAFFKIQDSPRPDKTAHRRYEAYVGFTCRLYNRRNEEIVPLCELTLYASNTKIENCFKDILAADQSSKHAQQSVRTQEMLNRNMAGTSSMAADAYGEQAKASMDSISALMNMSSLLREANARYSWQFRTGQLKVKDIPAGEYTVFATAEYGNQTVYWVKHLTVTNGRTLLELTNDATCHISTN